MSHATVGELRAALSEIRRLPATAARTMPAAFYSSPEFLALEKEAIFRREWVCLGCSSGERQDRRLDGPDRSGRVR